MAENNNELSVTLPDALRRQFAGVQRRLFWVETTVAVGSVLAGLAVSLLGLFVSDRFWNTPPALRLAFHLLGLAGIAAGFIYWARRWLWRRRTVTDLANLVQKKYHRLGDRLLGIVELSQEQRHLANFSPALYRAAIHQVAHEAEEYDFQQSISARPAEKCALGAGVAILCWIAIGALLPQASWNAFLRWAAPTADIARYTLVQLNGLPRELIVAHGEPFNISGSVDYRSFWKPQHISGRLLNLGGIDGAVDSGKIRLKIPGQVENGVLRLQVGDAVADINIVPMHRPALQKLTAKIQLPDYLGYPAQSQTLESGSLLAVEGSRVAFQGKISRGLSNAFMQTDNNQPVPLKIAGDDFISQPVQPDGMTEYTFNWRDNLGLSNTSPLRLSVATQKDAPPVADLPDLPREVAMLATDVLHIRSEASDDFGVLDLGLTWQVASDNPLAESITSEVKVIMPSTHVKKAQHTFLWSPNIFRIPADSTVELQAYARDYFPGRERSRTAAYRIRVLSPEEHAELIREQLADVMARMEEVTRLQEKIAANMRDARDSTNLPASQKSARVGESKDEQLQNASRLNELSEKATDAVQEAVKNPVFPADTIRQWSQMAQQWQKLAQDKMRDAAASMQSAQQSPPGSRQQQMAEATQKAEDILKALEKLQNAAGQHMDKLQALTLAQRLHKVSTREKEIGQQLIKTAPDTIGLPPDELPEKFKSFEQTLTNQQGITQQESDTLQGEISRFFERTKKTNYGAVSQEMKDSHTVDELERLGGLIGDNVAVQASRGLDDWSARFQKWSDRLEPKSEDSGSGQNSGGSSQKMDLTEQLIALLRLRESEMNLRDQTTVLDQQKSDAKAFNERAGSLADTQGKLGSDLEKIHQKLNMAAFDPPFAQAANAMKSVQDILRKPDAGKPADDAEVKSIETLSDLVNLINEQAQRGNPKPSPGNSSSSEEMAFLLRMMQNTANAKAMALQPATGLNHAGGTTSRTGKAASGNMSGKGAAGRNVNKASGVIENSPTEFRDALDIYFHGIEHTSE